MKKIFRVLSSLCASFTLSITSCVIPNNSLNTIDNKNTNFDKSLIQKIDFKTKSVEPQLLNFDSKVPNQTFSTTQNLPSASFNEFSLKVTGNMKNAIKIPANGNFNLIIQSGSTFQIIDSNANDGTAIVQIPQGFLEGFATVTRDASGKKTGNINIKDELYYVNQDLKELEQSNKGGANNLTGDYWYQLRKRTFPLTSNWSNPNGVNHVFKFTNSGIKQILFRWYKTNIVDYPLGVNEIGVNGGVVELPNVGKLEIPQGALNQNTIISLRQELNSYEVLDFEGNKAFDYVSPVIKIEPFSLELNKSAQIYLESDLQRIGNNNPAVVDWVSSDDKKLWIKQLNYSDYNNITHTSPAILNKFQFISKQILSFIKPDDEYQVSTSNNSFSIKSLLPPPTTPSYNIYYYYTLRYKLDKSQVISEVKRRIPLAYDYFKTIPGVKDPLTTSNIKIYMQGIYEKPITIGNRIIIPEDIGIEHELWHVFQNNFYTDSQYSSVNTSPYKNFWIHESSAEYMGAVAFKRNEPNLNDNMKTHYLDILKEGLTRINGTLPYFPDSSVSNIDEYLATSFMTFLANEQTGLGGNNLMNNIIDDPHLEKFHEYALHAYLEDRFDNAYNPDGKTIFFNQIRAQNIVKLTNLNTLTNPVSLNINQFNNSANYFMVTNQTGSTVDNDVTGKKVSIRINNISGVCTNNVKVKLLKYSQPINVKSDLKAYTEEINITNFNNWVEIPGKFKENYDNFVIISSNTTGKIEENPNLSCNYDIDLGIKNCTISEIVNLSGFQKQIVNLAHYSNDGTGGEIEHFPLEPQKPYQAQVGIRFDSQKWELGVNGKKFELIGISDNGGFFNISQTFNSFDTSNPNITQTYTINGSIVISNSIVTVNANIKLEERVHSFYGYGSYNGYNYMSTVQTSEYDVSGSKDFDMCK